VITLPSHAAALAQVLCSPKREDADRKIAERLARDGAVLPPTATAFVLVTSDGDFAGPLRSAKSAGFWCVHDVPTASAAVTPGAAPPRPARERQRRRQCDPKIGPQLSAAQKRRGISVTDSVLIMKYASPCWGAVRSVMVVHNGGGGAQALQMVANEQMAWRTVTAMAAAESVVAAQEQQQQQQPQEEEQEAECGTPQPEPEPPEDTIATGYQPGPVRDLGGWPEGATMTGVVSFWNKASGWGKIKRLEQPGHTLNPKRPPRGAQRRAGARVHRRCASAVTATAGWLAGLAGWPELCSVVTCDRWRTVVADSACLPGRVPAAPGAQEASGGAKSLCTTRSCRWTPGGAGCGAASGFASPSLPACVLGGCARWPDLARVGLTCPAPLAPP
jgi:hypothetical protein